MILYNTLTPTVVDLGFASVFEEVGDATSEI